MVCINQKLRGILAFHTTEGIDKGGQERIKRCKCTKWRGMAKSGVTGMAEIAFATFGVRCFYLY